MNRTFFVAIALTVIGGVLAIIYWQSPSEAPLSSEEEITLKNQIMTQDLAITERLNKSHYKTTLKQMANNTEQQSWDERLTELTEKKPEFVFVQWKAMDTSDSPVNINTLTDQQYQSLKPYLQQAEQASLKQQSFESDAIKLEDHGTYFVIGLPTESGALTAAVQADHWTDLEAEQKKDLRIVPYPSDKRIRIHAVDSDTMQSVKVDHPEENEGTSHYYEQEVVVKFSQDPTQSELDQMCEDISCTDYNKLDTTYIFRSVSLQAKEMISYFQQNWDPIYVEPHFMYLKNDEFGLNEELYVPNDEYFKDYQWNLPAIETLQGWNITRGVEEIIVAVVDTGVDLDHPDLVDKLVPGFNALDSETEPDDDVGHGSHVAGIVAANVDNGQGVAGISWFNKIMPVKVLDETGAGSSYDVARGIIWATDNGASVINLSLGNYVDSQFLYDAVRYAYDRGVVLVSASGNDNTGKPGYPAAYPEVLAVAATDDKDEKAVFSNYGDYIDVAAPGEHIASTYMDGQYAALSGTSMASPHVAALAAMIRSINPMLDNVEVMEIIRNSVCDVGEAGKDMYYGYGVINVKKALESALEIET